MVVFDPCRATVVESWDNAIDTSPFLEGEKDFIIKWPCWPSFILISKEVIVVKVLGIAIWESVGVHMLEQIIMFLGEGEADMVDLTPFINLLSKFLKWREMTIFNL